jgi:Na+(H+)/acetate symporter ActP
MYFAYNLDGLSGIILAISYQVDDLAGR